MSTATAIFFFNEKKKIITSVKSRVYAAIREVTASWESRAGMLTKLIWVSDNSTASSPRNREAE